MMFPHLDEREGRIWLDSATIPWKEARLHVLSHGLHYATTVFEGVRIYDGRPFRLKEHLERLRHSAMLIRLPFPWSLQELEQAAMAYIESEAHRDSYLRPIVWRGSEELGISGNKSTTHLAMACWPWRGPFPDRVLEDGLKLGIAPWRRPDTNAWPIQAKSSAMYMIGALNAQIVKDRGFDDAVTLDPVGNIAESTGANLFFVRNGKIITPPTNHALDGITRRVVIELCREAGIEVTVHPIAPQDLIHFDEVFLTGTAYEVQAVCQIESQQFIPNGPITGLIRNAYRTYVR